MRAQCNNISMKTTDQKEKGKGEKGEKVEYEKRLMEMKKSKTFYFYSQNIRFVYNINITNDGGGNNSKRKEED